MSLPKNDADPGVSTPPTDEQKHAERLCTCKTADIWATWHASNCERVL